mmetsp:Transcript_16721/g.38230  ORF Transcript_16721/g.38230 Transcript_16721/m.38230 type:complete len:90 (-) Transcript_16721:487-756(-)
METLDEGYSEIPNTGARRCLPLAVKVRPSVLRDPGTGIDSYVEMPWFEQIPADHTRELVPVGYRQGKVLLPGEFRRKTPLRIAEAVPKG